MQYAHNYDELHKVVRECYETWDVSSDEKNSASTAGLLARFFNENSFSESVKAKVSDYFKHLDRINNLIDKSGERLFEVVQKIKELEEEDRLEFIQQMFYRDRQYINIQERNLAKMLNGTCLIFNAEAYLLDVFKFITANPYCKVYLVPGCKEAKGIFKELFADKDNVFEYDILDERPNLSIPPRTFDTIVKLRVKAPDVIVSGEKDDSGYGPYMLARMLRTEGKLYIVTPQNFFYDTKNLKHRKLLQNGYDIEECTLFDSDYGPMSYFVIGQSTTQNDDIRVNGALLFTSHLENSLDYRESFIISQSELQKQWKFNVSLGAKEKPYLYLAAIADIIPGSSHIKANPVGRIRSIDVGQLKDSGIDYEAASYSSWDGKEEANKILHDGDLLVNKKINKCEDNLKCQVFCERKVPYVASSNIFVLRPYVKGWDGYFIKLLLDCPPCKKIIVDHFRDIKGGNGVVTLGKSDLETLKVPNINVNDRIKMSQTFKKICEDYRNAKIGSKKNYVDGMNELANELYGARIKFD